MKKEFVITENDKRFRTSLEHKLMRAAYESNLVTVLGSILIAKILGGGGTALLLPGPLGLVIGMVIGATGYLPKPFELSTLAKEVRRCLRRGPGLDKLAA